MTTHSLWHGQRLALVTMVGLSLLFSTLGCQQTGSSRASLEDIRTAYQAQDYNRAYRLGSIAADGRGVAADQAAYMAGMSAYKLGQTTLAINHLTQASRSSDKAMAGDALATIGLLYAQQNQHLRAAQAFLGAASRLTGQAKANALFYAAVSEQKQGRWADARSHLSLARVESSDADFKRQVDDQFAVTGYSLQVGAYANNVNAERAAGRWADRVRGMRVGQPRLVPQVTADGQNVVAVQIGQFSSYTTALMARSDLGEQEIIVVPLR